MNKANYDACIKFCKNEDPVQKRMYSICTDTGTTYDDMCIFVCDKTYVDSSIEAKYAGKCSDKNRVVLPNWDTLIET